MEWLWAYLRQFASMTKEMRPSHRIDVLSDAIKHYARWASYRIHIRMYNQIDRKFTVQTYAAC